MLGGSVDTLPGAGAQAGAWAGAGAQAGAWAGAGATAGLRKVESGSENIIRTAAGPTHLNTVGGVFSDPTGITTLGAETVHLYLKLVSPQGEEWKLGNFQGGCNLVGGFQGGCSKDLNVDGSCDVDAAYGEVDFDLYFPDQPLRRAIIGPGPAGIITLPEGVDL